MKSIRGSLITVLGLLIVLYASDAWIASGTDPEFPNALYFTGVGLSERGADFAKNNAIIEIKKQLSVSVNATVLDEQMSLMQGGVEVEKRNKVEARARLSTEGDVQGIEIVKTAQKGKIFYAFAVLDKKNFETNTRMRIKELKQDLEKQVEGARQDIASASPQNALKKLADARKTIQLILQQRTLLSAAAPITDAEKLNYTETDITALYEKCIGSIKTEKVSGDKQAVVSGGVPADPFVVKVTANSQPVSMLPLKLRDSKKKVVMTKYTEDNGTAEFLLGDEAETDVGSHTFTAEIGLPVSSPVINSQQQTYTYTVASNPCYAEIAVEVDPALNAFKDLLSEKVKTRLAKNDVMFDQQACYTLKVTVSAKETGYVQGISETRTIMKTDVTLVFALLDKGDKQVLTFQSVSKGTGSDLGKSAANGIEIAKFTADVAAVNQKICSGGVAIGAESKLKIAVFPFKNNGVVADWYDISQHITDMIITRLINTMAYDVVERTRLETLMEEKKLAMSGVVEQNEAMELAQYAGADLALIGSAAIHGGIIDIDARTVDVKTGVAKGAMSVSGYSLTNLRGLADALVDKLNAGGKKKSKGNCK